MRLTRIDEPLALCRLEPGAEVPAWATEGPFCSITRTPRELSVVCSERRVPEGTRAERGWVALEVDGPLDLHLVGVLASLAGPLAGAGVCLFAVSTFDTDYLLIRRDDSERAVAALRLAGHEVAGG